MEMVNRKNISPPNSFLLTHFEIEDLSFLLFENTLCSWRDTPSKTGLPIKQKDDIAELNPLKTEY